MTNSIVGYYSASANRKATEAFPRRQKRRFREMKRQLPKGWDESRIASVIDHYENQTEDDAAREDDRAFSGAEAVSDVLLSFSTTFDD